jgi:periplasmic protein TonB
MSYTPMHPDSYGLKKPLFWSVGFHVVLFSSLAFSAFFSHRGDSWGGAGGDNGVSVGLVARLPGVNLPRPEAVTTSRVVDESKGLYKSEPPPKPPKEIEPGTKTIPEFTKEKSPKYITTPSKILEDKTPPPTNAVPYGGGGSPALPYSTQFTMNNGATQGGMGFSGPGGGDFAGKFPAYVDAVRNRISSNWLQSTVDPSVRWAPRAQFTFQVLRDGTVANIQMTQSSGNKSVDNSALRAILSSSPMSGLPSNYSGNSVTVQFWFDFRR